MTLPPPTSDARHPRGTRPAGLAGRIGALRRDEDGAAVLFTLFLLFIMLIAGGIGIDVMRQEMRRAELQNTLDTAVLAAAGAPFGTAPKSVVKDYMKKNGMAGYLADFKKGDSLQTLNASKVSASADLSLRTYLMRFAGVPELGAAAAASAERRVPKLEVAMVLDVSGSMGDDSKLANLKVAAKKFTTTILNAGKPEDTTISIVPFSWDVTPGPTIFDALTVDVRHNYSTCLQFADDDYQSAAIDPETEQVQLIYTANDDNGFDRLHRNSRTCYTDAYARILPYSNSDSALHDKIDAFEASGNTSGHMGMKWGAALLDPKFQDVKLAVDGTPDATPAAPVPAEYDEGDTLKVIVMMGDGKNTYTNAFPLDSKYRGPESFLHKITYEQDGDERDAYFLYDYDTEEYDAVSSSLEYEEEDGSATFSYENSGSRQELTMAQFENLPETLEGYVSKKQYSWEEAWGRVTPDAVNDITGYGDPEDTQFKGTGRVSGGNKDTLMGDICTATKAHGVMVYTIGFEISKGGTAETELRDCATTPAHYYRADGIDITDAFSSIASNVVHLRLTQ